MFFCWCFLVCLFIHYGLTMIPSIQQVDLKPKSQLINRSATKHNNISLMNKLESKNLQNYNSKTQEKRNGKNKRIKPISPIPRDIMTKTDQDIVKIQHQGKQKARYDVSEFKTLKQTKSASVIRSKNGLQELKMNTTKDHFLSVKKREAEGNE